MQKLADFNVTLVAQFLGSGQVGVMPTDTVYGIVARAADQAAVARLYKLKKRKAKPGTVIASSLEQLEDLGIKHRYLKTVEQYWPGPISVVIPSPKTLDYLDLGIGSLALRVPDMADLTSLLDMTGPLLTTSANPPGQTTASNVRAAEAYFDDAVDFYVDGGDYSLKQPSTVIKVIDDAVVVIRQGAVKVDEASGRISS